MWRASKVGKGKWLEGIYKQHVRVDAFLIDKAMFDVCDSKIGKAFPFKEVMYRVKTGKQLVWLRKKEVEAVFEAVEELEGTVGLKSGEMEKIRLAIREVRKGKL